MNYFYIARFDGKHARIPKGYEVRFSSTKRIPTLKQLNNATSNGFSNELTEAAMAQGMDREFNVDKNLIKGLATEGHFLIDCPSLREEYEGKERAKAERKERANERKAKYERKERANERKERTKYVNPIRTTKQSRNDSGWGCLLLIFYILISILRRLFLSPWEWDEDSSLFGKIWHVIKVVFRIVVIAFLAFIMLIVVFAIIKHNN